MARNKENINLDKNTLYVKKTLQRVYDNEEKKTKVIIDVPKTIKSIRAIPISNKLYEILKPVVSLKSSVKGTEEGAISK